VRGLFKSVDAIIAPSTPCVAPKLGQATFVLDGVELPVRANIGIHTQPISFVGLPVAAVPVYRADAGQRADHRRSLA
jgi:aspartyl-tRNA(Asn)/glutamyl-tRNA(Gln) amidotransferase subunit A